MTRVRGQATVELALGALVFVTIMLVGIHFAEVGMLSLKVQEAGAYATWESTGRRVMNLEGYDTTPFDRILSGPDAVGPAATHAYQDFNGLTSVDRGSGIVLRALTKGSGMLVSCQENATLNWQPSKTASRAYLPRGGLECRAEAELEAQLPINFLNSADGFFKAKNYDAHHSTLKICGVGRAASTSCNANLPILLGDWGLAGDNEKGECRLAMDSPSACLSASATPNATYKGAVQRMWSPSFSKSRALANTWAGAVPADPNDFWFSYSGLESLYEQSITGEGTPVFNTGGPGLGPIPDNAVLAECFLGKPGC